MNKQIKALLISLAILMLCANAGAVETLMARVVALEPIIGGYPPNIENEEQANSVKVRYAALKKELDTLVKSRPDDQELLFMRGKLQLKAGHSGARATWRSNLRRKIRERGDVVASQC